MAGARSTEKCTPSDARCQADLAAAPGSPCPAGLPGTLYGQVSHQDRRSPQKGPRGVNCEHLSEMKDPEKSRAPDALEARCLTSRLLGDLWICLSILVRRCDPCRQLCTMTDKQPLRLQRMPYTRRLRMRGWVTRILICERLKMSHTSLYDSICNAPSCLGWSAPTKTPKEPGVSFHAPNWVDSAKSPLVVPSRSVYNQVARWTWFPWTVYM
jgi:hypothetical protein